MTDCVYHRPRSLSEAISLARAEPAARYVAGGTDMMVRLRESRRAWTMISLRRIPGLCGIEPGETFTIGALTTVTDLVAGPEVAAEFPVIVDAARALGSVQIRNVATVGGNLCNASPCADLAPPLLVLEASVQLEGPEGRRDVPLREFFLGPDSTRLLPHEVMTGVLVRRLRPGTRATFLKKSRVAMDLALASAAALLELEDGRCVRARVAAGSVAPTPLRLSRVEKVLEGHAITPDLLDEARIVAEQEVSPITDLRATADYRRHLVGVLVKRAISALVHR